MDAELEAIAREAVDSAYRIYSKLEPGLLETVYEVLFARELKNRATGLDDRRLSRLFLKACILTKALGLTLLSMTFS
jgi:hypothetical protein